MNRTVDPLLVSETASGNEDAVRYSGTQKELAEKAQEIILQNIYQHMTIREISFLLHVSPTQLKTCFRKVYGTPVYSFAKARRMKEASRLLWRPMRRSWRSRAGSVMRTEASSPMLFEA